MRYGTRRGPPDGELGKGIRVTRKGSMAARKPEGRGWQAALERQARAAGQVKGGDRHLSQCSGETSLLWCPRLAATPRRWAALELVVRGGDSGTDGPGGRSLDRDEPEKVPEVSGCLRSGLRSEPIQI